MSLLIIILLLTFFCQIPKLLLWIVSPQNVRVFQLKTVVRNTIYVFVNNNIIINVLLSDSEVVVVDRKPVKPHDTKRRALFQDSGE
jgi:hypothetical protein